MFWIKMHSYLLYFPFLPTENIFPQSEFGINYFYWGSCLATAMSLV